MTKKIVVQLKDRAVSGKEQRPEPAVLQAFKSAYDASGIHKGTTTWLFKQNLTDPVEEAVKLQVTFRNSIDSYHDVILNLYSAIVQFHPKRCAMDENEAKLGGKLGCLR